MTPVLFAHGNARDAISIFDWYPDPSAVFIFLVALFYKWGIRFYRNKPRFSELKWREFLFWIGVAVVTLSLCSPLDAFADRSFSMHMIQHLLLIMVGAPLILLGAPYLPVVKGMPVVLQKTVFIPLMRLIGFSRLLSVCFHPVVSLFLMASLFWIWHYPPLYDLALRSEPWHLFEHFCFFYSALLFWASIVTPYPLPSKLGSLQKMMLILGATIQNSILSGIIVFQDRLIYGFSSNNPFGLDQHTDQTLGGLIMWVPGSMMYIFAFGLCFYGLAKRSEAEVKRGVSPSGA